MCCGSGTDADSCCLLAPLMQFDLLIDYTSVPSKTMLISDSLVLRAWPPSVLCAESIACVDSAYAPWCLTCILFLGIVAP